MAKSHRYLLLLLACWGGLCGCGDDKSLSWEPRKMIPTEENLRTVLTGKDPFNKAEGAFLAGRYRYHSLIPLLRHNARDKSWYVRYNSLAALAKFNDRQSLPLFLESLRDGNSSVRFKSVEALGEIGDRSTLPEIICRLDDNSIYVRAAAAYTLGKLKILQSVPVLIDRLTPREAEMVRFEAHLALVKITGKQFGVQQGPWREWWNDSGRIKATPMP